MPLSTCEAELTSASYCAQSLIGVVNITTETFGGPRPPKDFRPQMFGVNEATNLIRSNSVTTLNVRHLSLQNLLVRKLTRDSRIKIRSKRSKDMTADMSTKILVQQSLVVLLSMLHMF